MHKIAPKLQVSIVVLFAALIGVSYGFGIYLFPAIAPVMMEEFGFTYAQMGITTGLVQAGFLLFALISGLLTATFGAFTIILWSLFLCTVSLAGLVVAPNFIVASSCLIILGGCAASIWVPMVEVSQNFIYPQYQGRAMGFMSSGTSYGVLVNVALIALFLSASNWRAVLTATFIIACGFLICTVAFFRYLQKQQFAQKTKVAEIDAGIPLLEKLYSIANKKTAVVLLLMFFAGIACMPFQSFLTSFLVDEHALSVQDSVHAWRIIGLTGMVSGFVMGWVADMITTRRALFCVCVSLAISSWLLIGAELNNIKIYSAAMLFGLSFYAIYGIIPAYISHIYKGGRAALVFSIGSVVLGIGGMLGNVAGGFIKELTGTFFYMYAICLTAAVLAALLTFFMQDDGNNRAVVREAGI